MTTIVLLKSHLIELDSLILIIAFLFAIGWFYSIRYSSKKSPYVATARCNVSFILFFSLLIAIIFKISSYHLLWIFPAIIGVCYWFQQSNFFLFSVYYFGGKMYNLAVFGFNFKEKKAHRRRYDLLVEWTFSDLSSEEIDRRIEKLKQEGKW